MTTLATPETIPARYEGARGGRRLLRRLWRRKLAMAGAVVALIFILAAALAPILAPHDPTATDFGAVLQAPSATYPFGTDQLGRDVLSRLLFGARASLQAGVLATAVGVIAAVPIGLVSGYYRGWVDAAIMRVNDALVAFPFIILAVLLAAILGPSLTNAAIAIGISAVPGLVRVTRGEVLALREEDFVRSSVTSGANDLVVIGRHILPNITNTLLVQATIIIPAAVIAEAALSFLGLGAQPPSPSWGLMLSFAQPYLASAPWFALFPGAAIFLTTLAFNLFGDGLRDALDPKVV